MDAARHELQANGWAADGAGARAERHGETTYRVFFVVAPDGLCYCLGQRQA